MGQYWKLFNLDKNEHASCGAQKLGEFFASKGNEAFVINLLLSGQPNHDDSWGGDRIILLGDYSEALPPNTVTDEDSDLLKKCAAMSILDSNDPVCAYSELLRYSSEKVSVTTATRHFPKGTVYVLRSLNKKEYVRRDTMSGYRKHKGGWIPGLAQALYTLVGWSEDPDTALWYNMKGYTPASVRSTIPLHRGAWAGNRIDVVALTDEMQKTLNEDGWTDISEEKAPHVSDVYACQDEDFQIEFLMKNNYNRATGHFNNVVTTVILVTGLALYVWKYRTRRLSPPEYPYNSVVTAPLAVVRLYDLDDRDAVIKPVLVWYNSIPDTRYASTMVECKRFENDNNLDSGG